MPSALFYPEEFNDKNSGLINHGDLMSEMILSEEGGRFYKDENIYQIRAVNMDNEIEKTSYRFHWMYLKVY